MTLVLENVTKKYHKKIAVDNISLKVNEGTILGLIGENGAGKSTTFRMIINILKPTSGLISWKGYPIQSLSPQILGYLPEERGLFLKSTVYSQLIYLARLKGIEKNEAKKRINQWLVRFDMEDHRDKKLEDLSKGNQQKVQLIASIIHQPELLILDEPFSGLDPINVELLKSVVKDLSENGATIIFSSHRMENVEELCDEICILKKGKVITKGSLNEILNNNEEKTLVIRVNNIDPLTLQKLNGVLRIKEVNNDKYELLIEKEEVSYNILNYLSTLGSLVSEFYIKRPDLNEVFIQKVGEEIE